MPRCYFHFHERRPAEKEKVLDRGLRAKQAHYGIRSLSGLKENSKTMNGFLFAFVAQAMISQYRDATMNEESHATFRPLQPRFATCMAFPF